MITKTIKCNCDYCNKEISEYEYKLAPLISLRIDLPNPEGGSGQIGALQMKLCEECFKNIGLENNEGYHKYIYSQNKFINAMSKVKNKILRLFLKGN